MLRSILITVTGTVLVLGCASSGATRPHETPTAQPDFVTLPELERQIRDSAAAAARVRQAAAAQAGWVGAKASSSQGNNISNNISNNIKVEAKAIGPAKEIAKEIAREVAQNKQRLHEDSVRAALEARVAAAREENLRIARAAQRERTEERQRAMKDSARRVEASVGVDEPWIRPKGGYAEPISVHVYNKDLSDVATLFAEKGRITILLSNEGEVQQAKVTADINNQPWNLALENLLKASKLRAVQDTTTQTVIIESETRAASKRPAKIIQLRYMYADEIIGTLQQYLQQASSSGTGSSGTGSSGSGDIINIVGGSGGGAGSSGMSSSFGGGGGAGGSGGSSSAARSRKLAAFLSPEKLTGVMDLIRQLDRKPATVSIMAQMITVNRSQLENLGLSYQFVPKTTATGGQGVGAVVTQNALPGGSNPTAGAKSASATLGISLGKVTDLNVFIDALKSDGLAEVESAPTVTTLSDHTANIQAGEFFIFPNQSSILTAGGGGVFIPGQQNGQQGQSAQNGQQGQQGGQYSGGVGGLQQGGGQFGAGISQGGSQFGQVSTGTVFSVTPYALAGNKVRVNINISRNGGGLSANGGSLSGTGQSASSEVIVTSGERIVIAGLRVNSRTTSNTKVPVLGDLPVIGGLFKNHQQASLNQELVIVIQPRITDPAEENPDDLMAHP